MSQEVLNKVKENSNFEILDNGKIKCKLTSHEIMPNLDQFEAYLKSKNYLYALDAVVDLE